MNILGHSDVAPNRKKDPGEKFPWENLAKYKIGIWHDINKDILKKLRNKKVSKIEYKKFFKYLSRIGYYFKEKTYTNQRMLIENFQRHFRQRLINGKVDQECLFIAKKISKLAK